ncbi:hypothetical protein ACTFIZ_012360 [Dictyostelium cf. discoideum]
MTPQAIRDGFDHLHDDSQMQSLANAARSSSEADYKAGGFFLTTVGRVQTPTLSIVVEREEKIRTFIARDYWEVKAEFIAAAGLYEGRWFDPNFKKNEFDPEARESRLWSGAQALAFQLLTLLRDLGVEDLTLPELTGGWEQKLAQIEQGQMARTEFMHEIALMTQQFVKRAKEYDSDTIPGDYATLSTPCPHCGGVIKENYRRFACSQC